MNGWDERLRGKEMIRESLHRTFGEMPDIGFDFVGASGDGDHLVVEWVMHGTRYRDIEESYSIRAVSVADLDGGKLSRASDYYDAHLLLSQLGLLPAAAAAGGSGTVEG